MSAPQRPPWRPDELIIVNIRGRAVISDRYLCATWRRDPWPGFSLAEGWYERVGGRTYRPVMEVREHTCGRKYRWQECGCVPEEPTLELWRKGISEWLRRHPVPMEAAKRVAETTVTAARNIDNGLLSLRRFDLADGSEMWVDVVLLEALVHLIDGKPAEWRAQDSHAALHALDERGRWLGALMPVRMLGDDPLGVSP